MKSITIKQAKFRSKSYWIISWALRLLLLPSIVFGGLKYFSWYFYFRLNSSSPFRELNKIPLNFILYLYKKTAFLSFFWRKLPPNPDPRDFHIFEYYYWFFLYVIALYIGMVFMQRYKNLSKRIKRVEQECEENGWRQQLLETRQTQGSPGLLININIKYKNDFIGILYRIFGGLGLAVFSRIVLLLLGLVR